MTSHGSDQWVPLNFFYFAWKVGGLVVFRHMGILVPLPMKFQSQQAIKLHK